MGGQWAGIEGRGRVEGQSGEMVGKGGGEGQWGGVEWRDRGEGHRRVEEKGGIYVQCATIHMMATLLCSM